MMTIYSRDLAYVHENRTLDFGAGRASAVLTGIPDRIDVSSVQLVPAGQARVRRLAYAYDLAGGDRILERAKGGQVRVSLRDNRVVEGTLMGSDAGALMIRTDDGGLETVSRAAVDQIRVPKPPADLSYEPALEVALDGASGGRVAAELSYLTGGLSWSAEHTLLRTGEKAGQWSSAVTVENTSGRAYDVPRLGLVAGDPRRGGSPTPPMPMMQRMAVSAEA